jgi:hypothetical protein
MICINGGDDWIRLYDANDAPSPEWRGPSENYYTNQYEWPTLHVDTEGITSAVSVSTEALRAFAENLRMLLGPLNDLRGQIEGVQLAPGSFFDAHELTVKVLGAGEGQAIQPTTLKFIETALNAITATATELDRLASAYATAEELNAATGRDLNEHIEDAKGYITAAVGA